jgi:hypothetical protein
MVAWLTEGGDVVLTFRSPHGDANDGMFLSTARPSSTRLMTYGRRKPEPFDSSEAAQLQRDIVATVVHDLTSITSALSLRVDTARGTLGERDVQAVAALTAQLRAATRPLVWLRGSPGRGALSPARVIHVSDWWQHMLQVVCALLPRGSQVLPPGDTTLAAGVTVSADELAVLSMLLLGACRHVVDVDPTAAVSLTVTLPQMSGDSLQLALDLAPRGENALDALATKATRWKRFCARTATRTRATLQWWEHTDTPSTWRWHVHT